MDFAHLHVHSNFSLLQGAFRIDELVEAAAHMGMPAVALTDTNGLYGAIEFYEAARAAGLRPVIGAEIVWGGEQCICLAASRWGYANLCRIVTERRLAGTRHYADFLASETVRAPGTPPAPFDIARSLAADPDGLFALTATPSLLRRLKDVVPEGRLYAELRADSPHSFETRCPSLRGHEDPGTGGPRAERRKTPGTDIADLAERLAVPLAATVNVNFLRPEDAEAHAVLSAIRENVALHDLQAEPGMLADPRGLLMPAAEVAARLPAAVREAAMRNSVRIAEACDLKLELGVPHFPRAELPPDRTACQRLRDVAYAGARRRYGRLAGPVTARLERELKVIEKLDFCDYFLVVHDIVAFAEREGIPHVGRGSAANSLVSYALGISAVDPLAFDLYFERFLNEFRTDVPDIDIDFCWRRRDDVIDYVYRRYGQGRVAMVSTHATLRARSAFRDVARVMGLPGREIDALSRRLPSYGVSGIEEAMAEFPEMADFPVDREPWRTVVRTAARIDGYVRHLGIHLGGLVIGDRPLTWYTALEDSTKGIVVTQYEMSGIERTGLVKIDLLGQRSLSIVAEAARNVREQRGVRVDLEHLPDPDGRTATLLRRGRTMGCFQIESPGMRQLLQMLRAEGITDLIQALSLIRPGPSSSGMKAAFIRRMRGEEPTAYATPLLEEALGGTYGVMLYQEDILRVAQEVAGFSLAEGDELRKYTSKKRSREKLAAFRRRFVRGAVRRGVDQDAAEDIWRQIEGFAAYSYCKAHAATYGHIAYQAAYLKAHYPAEFLAGVLANKAGFYDARTYLADARRFNVPVLGPCVRRSDVECRPEDGAIRPGLEFVKSLTRATMRRMLQERVLRAFDSLEDFCARVRPGREELENLILCGAFDSFGSTRPTLMMKADLLAGRARTAATAATAGAPRLFKSPPAALCTVPVPEQPPYPLAERVLRELQILGFSHSGHPLDAWDDRLEGPGNTPSFDLHRRAGRCVTVVGWLVTARRAVTRNHQYMKFLTLEDRHGLIEVAVFPDVYRRCGRALDGAGCYRVRGRVKEQHGSFSLVADDVRPLPPNAYPDALEAPKQASRAAGNGSSARSKMPRL
ncbi:MAG: DNA polymerase III subunit alpha [Candidatus Brocadiaceae bacterium]|nr:DNA polymerase III subunit alpha [Candidatus Brocadiaceae bacterium]